MLDDATVLEFPETLSDPHIPDLKMLGEFIGKENRALGLFGRTEHVFGRLCRLSSTGHVIVEYFLNLLIFIVGYTLFSGVQSFFFCLGTAHVFAFIGVCPYHHRLIKYKLAVE
jgi:hypothetical protein